jgi:hypothetical protein
LKFVEEAVREKAPRPAIEAASEVGQSVRDSIKSAWRDQTGEEPQDRQDREERRPKREDRRKE